MLNSIKRLFGLDDFQIELLCSDQIDINSKTIKGALKVKANKDNILYRLEMQLIEQFKKGRGDNKQESEFVWALDMNEIDTFLPANEFVIVPFSLNFEPVLSNMDKLGNNMILSGPVKIAKMIKGVNSQLRLDVKCCVRGVEKSPIISKKLTF